jgi:ADP-ribosylation factor-binding protein GGA
MCEEESDDSEAVAKLLEINDSIHRTVERYKLIKKGDVEAASKIPKGTLGTSTGVGKNAANELSLIDFDPEPNAGNGTSESGPGAQPTSVEDDLLGLSIENRPSGQAGLISLGFGANSGVPGPPLLSSTIQQNSSATSSSDPLPPRPNYDAFSPFTGSRQSSKPASPAPIQQQQKQHQQQKPVATPSAPADPFAALITPNSRSSSPFNKQPPTKPALTSSSLLDLAAETSSPAGAPARNGVATDDEWNFASSLPESTLPTSHRLEVHSSLIKIEFLATRPAGQPSIRILAQFSNNTAQAIHGLHFQVAVEKVWSHAVVAPSLIHLRATPCN